MSNEPKKIIVFVLLLSFNSFALVPSIYKNNNYTFVTTENNYRVDFLLPNNNNDTATFIEFASFEKRHVVVKLIIEAEESMLLGVKLHASQFYNPGHFFCLQITDKQMVIDEIATFQIVENFTEKKRKVRLLNASSNNKVYWRRVFNKSECPSNKSEFIPPLPKKLTEKTNLKPNLTTNLKNNSTHEIKDVFLNIKKKKKDNNNYAFSSSGSLLLLYLVLGFLIFIVAAILLAFVIIFQKCIKLQNENDKLRINSTF